MRLRSACPGSFLVLAAAILLVLGSATLAILWVNKQVGVEDVLARVRGPLAADDPEVVSLLQRAYLHAPSSLPYNLSTDPVYMKVKHAGTWHFIHKNIDLLFSGQRGGFFVEAGALDGERNSNTLWLEQNLGWTGLLIEPNPSSYQKLRWKQRKAWSSNTCLSPHPYPQEIVLVSMARKKDKYGVNKALESVLSYRGASHLLGYDLETRKFDDVLLQSDQSYFVTQCFPLASYLLALNVTTVDLLSLDIQGWN